MVFEIPPISDDISVIPRDPILPKPIPKNVITSHLLGLIAGSICYLTSFPYYIEWPLAVGIAIFLMVTLDFIHPPAAGTALAAAIYQEPFNALITILAATLIISQCRHMLKNYLKNLV